MMTTVEHVGQGEDSCMWMTSMLMMVMVMVFMMIMSTMMIFFDDNDCDDIMVAVVGSGQAGR